MAGLPVHYVATERARAQKQLLHTGGVPPRIIYLMETFIELCEKERDGFYGASELAARMGELGFGNSKAGISQSLSEIAATGAAIEKYVQAPGGKGRRKQYVLTDLSGLVSHYKMKVVPAGANRLGRAKKAIFIENEVADYLDLSGTTAPRMEKHFSMYDSAMKTGGHDTRTVISVDYYLGVRDSIRITAVTTTGQDDDIAHLADQRAMRVLNGFLYERIVAQKKAGINEDDSYNGYIAFDISDLCYAMGMHPSESNKDVARGMLRRLASTEFRIDAENSEYYKKNMGGFDRLNYRYLTEFSAITSGQEVDGLYKRSERFYRVRVHGDIVESLMRQSYLSHPGLARERSGLVHRLYNWSKAVIGVSAGSKPRQYTIEKFRDLVLPSARIDNFKRDFFALLSKFDAPLPVKEGDTKRGLIYGYYYTVIFDKDLYSELAAKSGERRCGDIVVVVARDEADPLIGDNSDHNQAVRRKLKEMNTVRLVGGHS